MAFEWDEQKRVSNLAKHGVDFRQMPVLFETDFMEVEDDREAYGETRFIAMGLIDGRTYVVVYTWRAGNRRLISARKANQREQSKYNPRHD